MPQKQQQKHTFFHSRPVRSCCRGCCCFSCRHLARSGQAPQCPETSKNQQKSKIFQKRRNASQVIRTHPNASERIRTHPNISEYVRMLSKTSKSLWKIEKNRDRGDNFSDVALFVFDLEFESVCCGKILGRSRSHQEGRRQASPTILFSTGQTKNMGGAMALSGGVVQCSGFF